MGWQGRVGVSTLSSPLVPISPEETGWMMLGGGEGLAPALASLWTLLLLPLTPPLTPPPPLGGKLPP